MTRETRLLVATIAVSIVVVLVLSTLRFPETPRLTEAPPAPLERLAASAAYDQLARSVERVSRRVTSDLVVIRIDAGDDPGPQALTDLLRTPVVNNAPRYFPALRIDDTRAVITGASNPGASVGDGNGLTMSVIAVDPLRRVTVLAVPPAASPPVAPVTLSALQTPAYVVVAEGTAAGVAFRPLFIGSADYFSDPRWDQPLLALGGTPLTSAGALVFSLDGQFLGAAVMQPSGTFAVAGAAELIAVATELGASGLVGATDFAISLQPLTPDLSRVLDAPGGVVVAAIDPTGPASRALEVTDVITSIANTAVTTPDEALVRLARTPPGGTAQLTIVRRGQPMDVAMAAAPAGASQRPSADAPVFERVAGTGSMVRTVSAHSVLARAGVTPGDVILRAANVSAPTPVQVSAALRDGAETGLILVVRREGDRDRVVAVPPVASPR